MYPNEALKRLREFVKSWEDDSIHEMKQEDLLQLYCDFAEQFHALDEWMSRDGVFPTAWYTRN